MLPKYVKLKLKGKNINVKYQYKAQPTDYSVIFTRNISELPMCVVNNTRLVKQLHYALIQCVSFRAVSVNMIVPLHPGTMQFR